MDLFCSSEAAIFIFVAQALSCDKLTAKYHQDERSLTLERLW